MKSPNPRFIKMRDFAVGFFGWLLLSNIIFFLLLVIESLLDLSLGTMSVIIWLLALWGILGMYRKKRKWISIGIAAEFIINMFIWIAIIEPWNSMTRILLEHGQISHFEVVGGMLQAAGFSIPTGLFLLISF